MSDEPSMDEILASLDQLLKEGESSNDEVKALLRSSSVEPEIKQETDQQADQEESVARKAELPVPRFFIALDHAVSAPSNDAGESEPNAGVDDMEVMASNYDPEQHERTSDLSESDLETDTQPVAKRIVLTDAMMVNDVQQSLPLAMDGDLKPDIQETESFQESEVDEVPAPDPTPTPDAPVPVMMWNEQDIEGLIDQVTDDVCSAMAAQLPELIRRALEDRLSSLIHDRMQNKDLDSGSKE